MDVQFDLNAFTWFHPEPRAKWIVNIPNRQCININAALLKEMPHSARVQFKREKAGNPCRTGFPFSCSEEWIDQSSKSHYIHY